MNKSTHYLVNDDISPHGFFKSDIVKLEIYKIYFDFS